MCERGDGDFRPAASPISQRAVASAVDSASLKVRCAGRTEEGLLVVRRSSCHMCRR